MGKIKVTHIRNPLISDIKINVNMLKVVILKRKTIEMEVKILKMI